MMEPNVNTPDGGLPAAHGLYDPQFEHDACGVGFVAHIKGAKSHSIIEKAIGVLRNLEHRGACGCDPETGDGAGITLQIPHDLFAAKLAKQGVSLPAAGRYGVAQLFLPVNEASLAECVSAVERILEEEGIALICWRDVPHNAAHIGEVARSVMPVMRQLFVERPNDIEEDLAFERKLFVCRRLIEKAIDALNIEQKNYFYICSFSARTVIYKGLLLARQIADFYPDLTDPRMVSALGLVHQRFSTNTFPTWDLAHPYRYLAHNGEINTLRGNRNWMRARQAQMRSEAFGADLQRIFPLVNETASDSATLDNAFELLVLGGRSLTHAMMMLIPEAWASDPSMDENKRGFYEYHACLIEPWDGPAAVAFTDGTCIGAVLDRNGLRPARYLVTKDDIVVMASETGVVDVPPAEIRMKGRLQPGKVFLVDMEQGRIIDDAELKQSICTQKPYREWVEENKVDLGDLPAWPDAPRETHESTLKMQQAFGYTLEDKRIIMGPMAVRAEQPLGSMGNDTPLAVLSNKPRLLYDYFKQLFAQVTNPPIDPIREELVTCLADYIGRDGNLLTETARHAHQLKLNGPILTNEELEKLRHVAVHDFRCATLPMHFDKTEGDGALELAVDRLCAAASRAVAEGYSFVILSDRGVDETHVPIPSLLATAAVHHHLVREGTRTQLGLLVESGEAREVQHFALLIGYGASAINPYLAFASLDDMVEEGILLSDMDEATARSRYIKAANKGLIKTFAKMGVATLQSYRGAQIFEAVGLGRELVERYFTGTPSRLGGIGIDVLQREAVLRHEEAYPPVEIAESLDLQPGGMYQWRRHGEFHQYNPDTIAKLQQSVRADSFETFQEFTKLADDQSEHLATLRGLLKFKTGSSIPLEQVEPAENIVQRFATGAMSLGSISREAHESLAIAMNRIGGKSNTGEGGEDPERFVLDANGDNRRSAIKQVASARFGVTTEYLVNADELQIKMAQGAKPGEGGELPGTKVDKYIARIRHTTPGVTLVSPPPHHDIYSIEDLAQLIFDLKNVNPQARISVKLVSEVGVGTVAAGVSKAHADHVVISGHDGGTGASPLSSIKHAGLPWELGVAETQQTLVENNLRGRIRMQTDGQIKTGRDVAVAALLGAEEFGFASAPLIANGCIMMRVCHLGTCPVGIATQNPVLRARFAGKPEYVVRYFFFVAEEVRRIMAQLGFRKMDEMIGRKDMLEIETAINHWKASGLDLTPLLTMPDVPASVHQHGVDAQDHGLDQALDFDLIRLADPAIQRREPVEIDMPIFNRNRTLGAMLSGRIAMKYGSAGLPEDTIKINLKGSAGQSLGAFLEKGVTITLEGDANDYLGKGLSGGKIVVFPPKESTFDPAENILAGNTLLYGATRGECYLRGVVGERFAVRNSGASAVVEGTGDHCCEYMTGGTVVVLGKTGRNFAAGMSGGYAYVWDQDGTFKDRVNLNHGLTELEALCDPRDEALVRELIQKHRDLTGSDRAESILQNWDTCLPQFVKVVSTEYRRALAEREAEEALEGAPGAEAVGVG